MRLAIRQLATRQLAILLPKELCTHSVLLQQIEDTPSHNKNGSCGIKGGFYAIFLGPYAIFSVEFP